MARPDFVRKNVALGTWKIRLGGEVSELEVGLFAGCLKEAEPDKYLWMCIRKCAGKQIGISFQYAYDENSFQNFCDKMKDKLKKRFGNSFVGWDISSTFILIE